MRELQDILAQLCASDTPTVLATLAEVEGSSYRRPGARMLVAGGRRTGSISGGCLEEDLVCRARSVAATGKPELVVYDTAAENDIVWGVGLGCHGVVRILLERLPPRPAWASALAENMKAGRPTHVDVVWGGAPGEAGTRLSPPGTAAGPGVFRQAVLPPPALAIFGAGDDAQPLFRLARELGWTATVADPRPALPTRRRFPGAFALVLGPSEELVARAAPPPGSLAVVMTHHYRHDVPIIRTLLPMDLAYVGLLGPRKRAERILADVEASGLQVTPAMKGRLRAPVGLDLGADAPEEVALSIIAEMTASLAGRDGRPLRLRERPIHV
ncbi:MAG TPA: XdhC family protein [Opitutaceae bacterium]|jgi:xanthine/CO dehydrogenase XdhC/CoxF family maturation factor